MMLKRVTIIVPVYNVEKYLSKCVESILAQTYTELQILLIDDGSSDGSGKICDQYAKMDRRIEVVHTANRGLVAARKTGLEHSSGEYIGFVDGDDYIEANMFEILLNEITEYDADFVNMGYIRESKEGSYDAFGEERNLYNLGSMKEREDFLINHDFRAEKKRFLNFSIWSKLYKRELIQNSYFLLRDDQQYGEDMLNLCLCILKSSRIRQSDYHLYHYVVKDNSMSHLPNFEYVIKEMGLVGNVAMVIQKYDEQIFAYLKKHISYYGNKKLLDIFRNMHPNTSLPKFYLEDIKDLRGKKIAIYGAGEVGRDYYAQLCRYRDIEIVAWFDSNCEKNRYEYADIEGVDCIRDYDFEKIIVAIDNEIIAEEIKNTLLMNGQTEEKIIWRKPANILEC